MELGQTSKGCSAKNQTINYKTNAESILEQTLSGVEETQRAARCAGKETFRFPLVETDAGNTAPSARIKWLVEKGNRTWLVAHMMYDISLHTPGRRTSVALAQSQQGRGLTALVPTNSSLGSLGSRAMQHG